MATPRLCSIPNCGKKLFARGWCNAHYLRWRKSGQLLLQRAENGGPLRFIHEVVMQSTGNDCITWPYARADGRGKIWVNGKKHVASRFVCELVNGAPPSPKHEAAHSCGKGHEGCVNPRHLSWKTSLENKADMVAHGTSPRGERQGRSKLTEADIYKIRASKDFQYKIAKQFGISQSNVNLIIKRKNWGWLPDL